MPIDPDAPWWVNVGALIIILAIVPAVTTWLTQRGTRRRVVETQERVAQTSETVGIIREQVQNTHSVNLRDDLDEKIGTLSRQVSVVIDAQQAAREDVGGLHSEVRALRQDIAGVRTDARQDRRTSAETRRVLDEHIAATTH